MIENMIVRAVCLLQMSLTLPIANPSKLPPNLWQWNQIVEKVGERERRFLWQWDNVVGQSVNRLWYSNPVSLYWGGYTLCPSTPFIVVSCWRDLSGMEYVTRLSLQRYRIHPSSSEIYFTASMCQLYDTLNMVFTSLLSRLPVIAQRNTV
jgi:hypothetical protein